jgi:hypothetical protein
MSNVANYAEARAARTTDLPDVDGDLAALATDEMTEALANASALPVHPVAARPTAPASPLLAQWERFRPAFAEAMEGGLYSIDDLEAEVGSGESYFWPGSTAAVIAKVVTYPSGELVMQTLWAVGEMNEVLALAPGIEATARLLGCSSMLVEGRKGWQRVLQPHGYEPWSVTVRKAL